MNESTMNSRKGPARICRENGWDIGTDLVGDEGYGPSVIRITAIGESSILARLVSLRGEKVRGAMETTWTLSNRDWKPVKESE